MQNTIKRIISCLSVVAVCCISNLGLSAKAISPIDTSNVKNMTKNIADNQNSLSNSFVLFSGHEIVGSKDNTKLADHYSHYSHRSHVSHQSHYSSRY